MSLDDATRQFNTATGNVTLRISTLDTDDIQDDASDWVIRGLLQRDATALFVGPSKAGKTTLIGNLAKSLTDGTPFLGFDTAHTQAGEVGDGRTLQGLAAVFNTPAIIESWEGRFTEIIERGAFEATIRERMPIMQYNHGRDPRVGTVPIGSVQTLRETERGLWVEARLYSNDVVEPVRQAIEGRSIRGMSIAFRIRSERWTDAEGRTVDAREVGDLLYRGDDLTRTIHSVDLIELGPVLQPAYPATTVGVRSVGSGLGPGERASYLRKLALRDVLF